MVEKQKRGTISEEDISTVLQRYTATTVLALLQEVAQVEDVNLDWNELVNKTTTGITNPREYQMLWRHLAYRDTLLQKLDDEAQPLDDDSDLEYELEAFPTVISEASTEAAACVKVLIASGLPSDSSLPNGLTVEAPLTINIPSGQSTRAPSENSQLSRLGQGTNITIPVSVQKQPLPIAKSAEGLNANGSGNGSLPVRRKRKPWSANEDMELIAAVKKCGEGNWANILKGDFKGDKSASQLSQRWAIIKKRKGNLNVGSGSQLSEAQLAARQAVSLALARSPNLDKLKAASSIAGTNSSITPTNSAHPTAAEASSVGSQSQHLSRQDSIGTLSISRGISKNHLTKSALSPNELVKASAVAAGARIATASDAASLLKAAQAKNAVHIMPGGGSLTKSNPLSSPHLCLPPNVHYIRTGLAATPLSAHSVIPTNASRSSGNQQVQGHAVRPVASNQSNLSSTASESNPSSEPAHAATSVQANELEVKIVKEEVQEDQASVSGNALEELVHDDKGSVSGDASNKQVKEDQAALTSSEKILKSPRDFIADSKCSSSVETEGNDRTVGIFKQGTDEFLPVKSGCDSQPVNMELCENQTVNEK